MYQFYFFLPFVLLLVVAPHLQAQAPPPLQWGESTSSGSSTKSMSLR
jgi:hypothetical protein